MGRAQVSMEYLFIVAFAILLTIPLLALFFTQIESLQETQQSKELTVSLTEIATTAEQVYYLGNPAVKTINIFFPEDITSAFINGTLLVGKVQPARTEYEVTIESSAPLNGTLKDHSGLHVIRLTAKNNTVEIVDE